MMIILGYSSSLVLFYSNNAKKIELRWLLMLELTIYAAYKMYLWGIYDA